MSYLRRKRKEDGNGILKALINYKLKLNLKTFHFFLFDAKLDLCNECSTFPKKVPKKSVKFAKMLLDFP